jgi:membrane-bound lytic murein transglycosylase B
MTLKTISLSLSILLLTACSSQKINKENIESNITSEVTSNIISEPILSTNITTDTLLNENISYGISGDFAGNYKLHDFIQRMVEEHGFDETELNELFSQAQNTKLMPPPVYERRRGRTTSTTRMGKWDRYKNMFVYENNIQRGLAFWEEHKDTLNRAYEVYGVLPEYIMGIIGIETAYGVNFGKKRVIDVLTTKSMTGDRRENFYTKQLEDFLIMTRKANLEPSELMGSNAGAMGYGQFIPSSYLAFAVDFNNDGITDLWDPEDAIGSIANYFAQNGWKRSLKTVAVRAKYRGNRFRKLKTGYKTKYSPYVLRKRHHIIPRKKVPLNGAVSLIKLPRYAYDELWMGTHNFRVITTYNHSELYGMAVYHLAQAVRQRRYGR